MGSSLNQPTDEFIKISKDDSGLHMVLSGEWILQNLPEIEKRFNHIHEFKHPVRKVIIDLSRIALIDTAGMIFFMRMRDKLRKKVSRKGALIFTGVWENIEFRKMFQLVAGYKKGDALPVERVRHPFVAFLERIGKHFFETIHSMILFFDFIGRTYSALWRDMAHFSFRFKEITNHVKKAGVSALPIIGVTTFLIGVVIAFQSAVQLQQYGANIFIVEIVSIAITRELSPIITSIVVAGRSGSAYAAQLGAMKITEELDAMSVMGFDIFRFLIIPRTLALIIVLPLLIFFGDVIGILGGMVVAKFQLGITPVSFIGRLHKVFAMRHFYAGLIKGPFFAATIAAIGCFRGLQVTRDTESIGRQTTVSVVNSIFMVIVIDALFSIIFTELGI